MLTPPYPDVDPSASDPRWVALDVLAQELSELMYGHDAAADLSELLFMGRLRLLVRYGPDRRRCWVPLEVWTTHLLVCVDDERGGFLLEVVHVETGEPISESVYPVATFYIWRPEFDALWPTALSGQASSMSSDIAVKPAEPLKSKLEEKLGRPYVMPYAKNSHRLWEKIIPHLIALYNAGKLPDQSAARHEVDEWLAAKGETMSRSAIYAGVDRYCAGWWD